MGVPGCGKGTQATKLRDKFDWAHVSVGDILRWHIHQHTKLGTSIRALIARGEFADDGTVNQIVRTRLEQHDWNYGFILDGYPRSLPQADFFFRHFSVDGMIYLDVPDEVVIDRISSRLICRTCAQVINLAMTPRPDNICPSCGGQMIRRAEDQPDAVAERMRRYRDVTRPIYDVIAKHCPILTIDGTQSVERVQIAIEDAILGNT